MKEAGRESGTCSQEELSFCCKGTVSIRGSRAASYSTTFGFTTENRKGWSKARLRFIRAPHKEAHRDLPETSTPTPHTCWRTCSGSLSACQDQAALTLTSPVAQLCEGGRNGQRAPGQHHTRNGHVCSKRNSSRCKAVESLSWENLGSKLDCEAFQLLFQSVSYFIK